jgi:hypothetical protein
MLQGGENPSHIGLFIVLGEPGTGDISSLRAKEAQRQET